MKQQRLISDYHLDQNIQLHNTPPGTGASGYKWGRLLWEMIKAFKVHTVLDYGCGQGTLRKELMQRYVKPSGWGLKYQEYDPAIKGKERVPTTKFELVVSTDVLEHIEPELLDNVIAHMFGLSRRVVLIVIAIHPANKILPDGRNAHLTIEPPEWWRPRLLKACGWKKPVAIDIMTNRQHKDYAVVFYEMDKLGRDKTKTIGMLEKILRWDGWPETPKWK